MIMMGVSLDLIARVQNELVPEFLRRLQKAGWNGYSAVVEPVGNTVNVVLMYQNRWMAEYAVFETQTGPDWIPVYRV